MPAASTHNEFGDQKAGEPSGKPDQEPALSWRILKKTPRANTRAGDLLSQLLLGIHHARDATAQMPSCTNLVEGTHEPAQVLDWVDAC
jgi:hypothetical protein